MYINIMAKSKGQNNRLMFIVASESRAARAPVAGDLLQFSRRFSKHFALKCAES